jgi:hypothetical protein
MNRTLLQNRRSPAKDSNLVQNVAEDFGRRSDADAGAFTELMHLTTNKRHLATGCNASEMKLPLPALPISAAE